MDQAVPMWVLLHVEGARRGFRNALAFRRWCRGRGIPVRRDGKMLWVSPADIDRAIEALPAPAAAPDTPRSAVLDTVAAITGRAA